MSAEPGAMRAGLADDEPAARAVLAEYLAAHPEVAVVASCGDGFSAVKAIAEHKPDLLFLDVEMPKLSGFEVLELVEPPDPAVIFTTAFDRYAVRAFEVHAVDYLLKPFSPERLAEALARAAARLASGAVKPAAEIARLRHRPGRPLDRIVLRSDARIHVVPVEHLDYAEARDDQIVLKVGKESYRKTQTLAELEQLLDPQRFVRIHRSFLLNLERLARLDLYAKDSYAAVLTDGSRLPVSRTGYARLKELL
jgi:two-component system, LytTR family, response regulator